MANKVVILGSLNVDTILRIKRVPQPGETLQMNDRSSAAGGKGANQAVAAARAGAETSFIGQVGNDDAGKFMIESLKDDQVDTSGINVDSGSGTGSAYIFLDENGQNSILVYGGANQKVTATEVHNGAEQIKHADFVVTQFETPQLAAIEAFKLAKEAGAMTILNPAPASEMLPELLELSDIVVPNETESASLTGIEVTDEASMMANAAAFEKMGVKNLIITVGSKGAFYSTEDGRHDFVPAFKVKAIDTTAAGDTFIGALSSQLKTDLSNIKEALTFAQRASSITVQRLGAMPSIPTKAEIEAASK
ncbi:ribokinase family sugar kinase [Paucilactobacillus oligofermentans DSM 15707 = LMG 22743]|uniref:Ribokinase n=1 Tax=Paucilactobacillus oligofermentans DSM 15707 = LMG 22743 TaxID=1423778 RepID=A0A0R1REV1_9LACO|nr:ribokinase [Paucilactobacillus oligofermentans]KRL55260.1 ribokinase family sugar kinase [Paucilactobacillus oligofermentans DSM 15707 = LMG 22743]CUS25750.1 Ribokinase 1 [Paucilactobacillus oligofermentans DSM 15707 = LMG 22743]